MTGVFMRYFTAWTGLVLLTLACLLSRWRKEDYRWWE